MAPTRAFDAVIFDIGNVFVEWSPAFLYEQLALPKDVRCKLLDEVVTLEWHTRADAGLTVTENVRQRIEAYPEYGELIELFDTDWMKTIGALIQNTVDIANALHEADIPLYGLTNFAADKYPPFAQAYGFTKLFSDVLVSGEVGMVKPDPRIFALAIDKFGVIPGRTLFIDDRLDNCNAAEAFGLQVHHYQGPDGLNAWLDQLGFSVLIA